MTPTTTQRFQKSIAAGVSWLSSKRAWAYVPSGVPATEPASWSALALAAHGAHEPAARAARWLVSLQRRNGALGADASDELTGWATGLAVLAWSVVGEHVPGDEFADALARGVGWLLDAGGETSPRKPDLAHDTTIKGWSWAPTTHSWLEPTCIAILGLRAAGLGNHPRVEEGMRLVGDRLLPSGGANYGNTVVLGQELPPHVQATGLALLALEAGVADGVKLERSAQYLERAIREDIGAPSLAYAALGLAAVGRYSSLVRSAVERALRARTAGNRRASAYEVALLLLAVLPCATWSTRGRASPHRRPTRIARDVRVQVTTPNAEPPWFVPKSRTRGRCHAESVGRAPVFIARNQSYEGDLATTIETGLLACGVDPSMYGGKKVLLKPNLVEPSALRPHMTTHPAVVVAAARVFRSWGAHVAVGEAPGHMRDTQTALLESGMDDALRDARLTFADLNYEPTGWRENTLRMSALPGLHLPLSVLSADVVVSLPKLKTHHWVGFTCALKNLYGVVPGSRYGWPKNVLHRYGIPATIVEINKMMPETLAVVDAIECMEGDGPIMGDLKPMGLLLIGADATAVDATAARLIGLEPERIGYLIRAEGVLGTIAAHGIEEVGERSAPLVSPFRTLPLRHLVAMRADAPEG